MSHPLIKGGKLVPCGVVSVESSEEECGDGCTLGSKKGPFGEGGSTDPDVSSDCAEVGTVECSCESEVGNAVVADLVLV